ncbi:LOB domain-containing protein 42 [Bienertia sinuspersici]
MRTSCNGCRVLRKGCSDECVIRPCLQWMKSADAQANATVFLANCTKHIFVVKSKVFNGKMS